MKYENSFWRNRKVFVHSIHSPSFFSPCLWIMCACIFICVCWDIRWNLYTAPYLYSFALNTFRIFFLRKCATNTITVRTQIRIHLQHQMNLLSRRVYVSWLFFEYLMLWCFFQQNSPLFIGVLRLSAHFYRFFSSSSSFSFTVLPIQAFSFLYMLIFS